MKVIIIGGGFSGLTLANALEKADIDFVLLEARSTFDPVLGATIGISPGCMRILDQFSAAQEILDQVCPLSRSNHRSADGKLIVPSLPSWDVVKTRFEYPEAFMRRRHVARAMYNALEGKSKLLLNKRLAMIKHSKLGVVVHCDDGSRYEGDMVLGCDGVHSKVRREMWRIADEQEPGFLPPGEKTKMTAEYMCLYGNSAPVPGFNKPGDFQNTYDKNQTLLSIVSTDFIGWFFMKKMDRIYHYHEADYPRFTKEDAKRVAEQYCDNPIDEHHTFREIWEGVDDGYALVPMEEALFEKWSFGRIAIVGDAAHKMTSNHGQAGNNSIESAAALANQLVRLRNTGDFSHEAIEAAFRAYQAKRQPRLDKSYQGAADVCRMQCLTTWKDRLMIFGLLPFAGDLIAQQFSEVVIGSEVLEFLPLPDRSFNGTCGFNPKQGTGNEESLLWRAVIASPLLLLAFLPTNIDQHPFLISSSSAAMYAIWLIESNRRANALTPMQIPAVFALLASVFGIETIAPWYYFLHYVFSPIEKFAAADMRMTNVAWTRTVLPAVVLVILLTSGIWPAGKTLVEGQPALIPFGIFLFQLTLVKTEISTTDLEHDILHDQKVDLPSTRTCIHVLSGYVAVSGMWKPLRWTWDVSTIAGVFSLIDMHIVAAALWLLLLTYDLKRAGMTDLSWIKVLFVGMVSCLLVGPTSTLLQGWLWREEMLATKKEGRFGGKRTRGTA